ncbi:MAG: RNA polymerase sigma-70 factor [Odoribacteraceae bacterium]|jgi:RNA polymerase sigma-70 factor (ECF subfamily)|nr:RNA polymerase sigma-70 factor [Odoribacteraceae bacterium]
MESSIQVALFRAGDEGTFREIYREYAPALRGFAARYVQDRETVDDMVQEAFVHLWEKRRDLHTVEAIKAYLYRVVQRKGLNVIRHQKVKERYAMTPREENEASFLEGMIEAEIFRSVLRVFEELPPACKTVYRMSLDGMSHEEIAGKLNISVNTVKKHKNNAHHYMRDRLKGMV